MSEQAKKYHEEKAIEKSYDFHTTKRLFSYLKPYWKMMSFALILTVLTNVLISLQPYFTKIAIDDFIVKKRVEGIWLFALAYFALFLFRFLFSYIQEILLNIVGQKIMFDLRSQIYSKLQNLQVSYYDKNPVGRIITRLTSDVDALNELFTSGVIEGLGDMVVIIAIIGFMFWLDWKLAIVSLIVVPLLFLATNWFRKRARVGFDKVRTRMAKINAFLQEHISGAQTVQLFNAEEKARENFAEINNEYREANIETIYYYSIFYPMVEFIGVIGITVIIWFGGYQILTGTSAAGTAVTIGTVIAFIQYSQQLFQPIRNLSDKFNVLQAAIVASHRVFLLLDEKIEIESPKVSKKADKTIGKIEFRNVWFAYNEGEWVLKNISFTIEPGESVALVGHTGSGKTTVTNLLMRFYDIQKGKILLDGVDVRDWDLKTLRENFAVVLQDVFLFSGSIANNIRLGNENISDEKVKWAAEEVHADGFINRLEKSYQTKLKERGGGLSVGQKQLISFARALAFEPSILILDEATSSIDTETEQFIQQAVNRIMENRTSLVVAHRLSTIQRCDRILVFHHGELREKGTHNQLIKQKGLYWRLFQLQYGNEKFNRQTDNGINLKNTGLNSVLITDS
ncbi:MAG: ABC transporter ATP-binding protein/permease [Acidobacteriota bacterium]|nr:ABC transporter ATP-binding protein/permease [Acidobacteriota bacterium]